MKEVNMRMGFLRNPGQYEFGVSIETSEDETKVSMKLRKMRVKFEENFEDMT
jgi:hypothetical protein